MGKEQTYAKVSLTLSNSFVSCHSYSGVSTIWLEAVPRLWIGNIVELRDTASEKDESCTCPENSLSQRLTRGVSTATNYEPILGVVGIPHRTSQQAYLSNQEKHPERNINIFWWLKPQKSKKVYSLSAALQVQERSLPTDYEKQDCTSSWTPRTQRLSTAEASACHSNKDLTSQEE